jgi:hypothetical protein
MIDRASRSIGIGYPDQDRMIVSGSREPPSGHELGPIVKQGSKIVSQGRPTVTQPKFWLWCRGPPDPDALITARREQLAQGGKAAEEIQRRLRAGEQADRALKKAAGFPLSKGGSLG